MHLLLVHSPLVGPATLEPLEAEFVDRGHTVTMPDLRGVVADPRPGWLVDRIAEVVDGAAIDAAVAHSGSGAILPTVASQIRARAAVFLDAVLPELGASAHVAPPGQRALLAEHVDHEGVLQPWLTWWTDEVVAELLPDRQQRATVAAGQPRLPLRFYKHEIPLPDEWVPSAFISLGDGYGEEAARARSAGWPTLELELTHLATVTAPAETAEAVLSVLRHLGVPDGL